MAIDKVLSADKNVRVLEEFSGGLTQVDFGTGDLDDVLRVLVLPEEDPLAMDSEESLVGQLFFRPNQFLHSPVFDSWYGGEPPFDNTVLIVNWDDDPEFKSPVAAFTRNRPGISLTMPVRSGVFAERTRDFAASLESPKVTVASNLKQAYAHYLMGSNDKERRITLGSMLWNPFGYVDTFGEATLVYAKDQQLKDRVNALAGGDTIRMAGSKDGDVFRLDSLRLVMQLNKALESSTATPPWKCCCPSGYVVQKNEKPVVVCYLYECTNWPAPPGGNLPLITADNKSTGAA